MSARVRAQHRRSKTGRPDREAHRLAGTTRVWSIQDQCVPGACGDARARSGLVYSTNGGRPSGHRSHDGESGGLSTFRADWQSPVVVDNALIEGDCSGVLHAYDVSGHVERPLSLELQLPKGLHRVDARV